MPPKRQASSFQRPGLTLLELLFVIGIIGILIAILLPAIQAAREAARRHSCSNNMTQLILAIKQYETLHTVYPPGTIDDKGPIDNRPFGYHMNWIAQILPMLEQGNLYQQIDFQRSVYDPKNGPARGTQLNVLECPSWWGGGWGGMSNALGRSGYAAVHHPVEAPIDVDNHGMFFLNSRLGHDDVVDGHSQTLFLGEKTPWTGADLGWMSGTRATLRNTGWRINADTPGRRGFGGGGAQDDPWLTMATESQDDDTEPANAMEDAGSDGGQSPRPSPASPDGADDSNVPQSDATQPDATQPDAIQPDAIQPDAPQPELDQPDPDQPGRDGPVDGVGDELPGMVGGSDDMLADDYYDYQMPMGQLPTLPPTPQMVVGGFSSSHPGGANFAFGDGSVRFLPATMDLQIFQQLGHRFDGELADLPD